MARKYTLAEQLRDPAKRAKIPTSKLPPKYRAARLARLELERKNNSPLYQPNVPLVGRDARAAVNDLVDLETRPVIDALRRRGQNLQTQGGALSDRVGDVYADMARREAEGLDRQRALREVARGTIGALGNANIELARQAGETAQQQVSMPEGLQGSARDRLAAETAQLTGRAGFQSSLFKFLGEQQADATQDFSQNMAASRQFQQGEVQSRLANKLANSLTENEANLSDVYGKRGELATKYALDIRDKEFTNELARKQFGLQTQKEKNDADAAEAALKERAAARRDAARERKLARLTQKALARDRLTQQERNSLRSSGIDPDTGKPIPGGKLDPKAKKKGGGAAAGDKLGSPRVEPTGSQAVRTQVLNRAEGFLPKYAQDTGLKLDKSSRSKLVAKLRQTHPGFFKDPVDERVLSAALDLAIDGRVSSNNLKFLRKRNFYISSDGSYWGGGNRGG